MAVYTHLREIFQWIGRRFQSLRRFLGKHEETCVLIVTLLWVIWWSFYQDRKGDELAAHVNELVSEQGKNIRRLIKIQKANIEELTENYTKIVSEKIFDIETNQKTNTKKLTEEYAKIVSEEISDLDAKMISIVSRNIEMTSGEAVRKIIASHENIQRARDDIYTKALDEACKAGYIYEKNQVPDEAGFRVFITGENWKPGEEDDEKGSSLLLTTEEKKDIGTCLDSYFGKEKSGDELIDMDRQKKIFQFLLQKAKIGSIVQSPTCEITYRTLYNEKKTELLMPLAKLGAVIGHIGDELK